MAQIVSTLITIVLLSATVGFIARVKAQTARSLWLFAFTLVVASAVTMMVAHAFVTRWGIRTGQRDGLFTLVDGSASRPFVYRRLTFEMVGSVARFTVEHVPEATLERVVDPAVAELFPGQTIALRGQRVQLYVAYLLVWLTLFVSVPALAAWLRAVRACSWLEALVAATLAMSLVPLTLIHGGYIYDSMELLLWTLLLLSITQRWLSAVPLLFLAFALNKESALALVPVLFPLLARVVSRKSAIAWSLFLAVLGGAWLLFVRHRYAGSPGLPQEWPLGENLRFWADPRNYLKVAPLFSPALPAPRSENLLVLLLVLVPIRFGFRNLRPDVKRASVVAAAIVLPLFLLSGSTDETRVLGPVFPFVLAACSEGVARLFERGSGAEFPT